MNDDQVQGLVRAGVREEIVLKVSNSTNVHKLATSVERNAAEGKRVVISCVGVQSISQAIKSVAIVNGQVAPQGFVFLLLPFFHMESSRDRPQAEHTVMRFVVIKHKIGD